MPRVPISSRHRGVDSDEGLIHQRSLTVRNNVRTAAPSGVDGRGKTIEARSGDRMPGTTEDSGARQMPFPEDVYVAFVGAVFLRSTDSR